MTPLERVSSIKVKLGLLVAASALVAAVVASVGRITGVSPWISIPVTIGIALAVTQLLAAGMTSPLRQMTGSVEPALAMVSIRVRGCHRRTRSVT